MYEFESMRGDLPVGGSFFFETKWVKVAAPTIATPAYSNTNAAASVGGPDSGIEEGSESGFM